MILPKRSYDRARGRNSSEAGNSIVEMAFLATLLSMLLLGAFDLGHLAYFNILTNNAAHAGAQYGAQNRVTAADNTGMQNAALNDAGSPAGMTATGSHYCECANGSASTCLATDCSGSHMMLYVKVNTNAPYTPVFSFLGLPPAGTVQGQAVERVAQ